MIISSLYLIYLYSYLHFLLNNMNRKVPFFIVSSCTLFIVVLSSVYRKNCLMVYNKMCKILNIDD